jgi:hypothetical protein
VKLEICCSRDVRTTGALDVRTIALLKQYRRRLGSQRSTRGSSPPVRAGGSLPKVINMNFVHKSAQRRITGNHRAREPRPALAEIFLEIGLVLAVALCLAIAGNLAAIQLAG